MSWVSELGAVRSRFAGWTASRIKWAGVPFQEITAPHIAVHVINGQSDLASLGLPSLRRHIGVVSVQILDRENNGDVNIRTLAEGVADLFLDGNSRLTLSSSEYIDFQTPSLSGMQTVNGWNQRNVTIPFFRDEMRPVAPQLPPPPGVGAGTLTPWESDVFTLAAPQTVFVLTFIPQGSVALFVNGLRAPATSLTIFDNVATIGGFTPDVGMFLSSYINLGAPQEGGQTWQ